MAEMLRLVRVFLASPGDLPDERRLVKETEEELNNGIASYLDCRIEIKGWEDTLSGSDRPQAIINQELDICELFIGMMSRRWGTPPSVNGEYSSGFEEEFKRSSLRCEKTSKPEMAMYFKTIDPKFLIDPGEDLKKVLAFKDQIASEKSIYYENFDSPYDLQKRVRLKIQNYLIKLIEAEKESQEEEQAKTKSPTEETSDTQSKEPIKSPFSAEGHQFLERLLEKTEVGDSSENITSLDIGRFRLLSNIISASGNDEPSLGVHDANIIYSNKDIELGSREMSGLIDCGLKNIRHENVPFWHWYALYRDTADADFLPFRTFSNEDVRVGALEVMKLIGTSFPIDKELEIDRDFFLKRWLSEESSERLRIAALGYLKCHGRDEDMPLIQSELDRADSKTSKSALEALVSIQHRYNKGEALKTAFANQFEHFDEKLLNEALSASSALDDETLRLGLKHRNKKIRLESFKILSERKLISSNEMQELQNDPFAEIRKAAVDCLLSNNALLNDEAVKNILVKPQKRGAFYNVLASPSFDEEGQACYDEYLFSKYSSMPENELLAIVKKGTVLDDIPYLALCSRYFKNHAEELRKNVDDQFERKFEDYIEYLENMGSAADELRQKARRIEDVLRKSSTRKGLDILCNKGNARDLDRIRRNMRSAYVKSSEDEIEYMRKHGEWEDIPFIVKAEQDFASARAPLTLMTMDLDRWNRLISHAIYSIGKDRLGELLRIEVPSHLLANLIEVCSSAKFSEISDERLFSLLNHEEDKVRKRTSLKSIQSFTKSRLQSLLKEYVEGQEHRYYNVIFWLDFGVSMPKSVTRKAINLISNE